MNPAVGDALPRRERTITSDLMMAYGAATWDWHRLHYDQRFAESQGLPGPVLDGQAFGAFFAAAAMAWGGPGAFVRALSFRMRAMVFAGEVLACEGEVAELATGQATLAQRLSVGDRLVADATTVLRLAG